MDKLLHTNNVAVRHIKNFLQPLKVNEVIQNLVKRGLTQSASDASELHFKKILTGVVFAAPFFSMRRTILIQSALCFPDPGQAFTHPERRCTTHKKIFRASQSQ